MAWTPASAEERSYYDRLFQLADVSNAGKLLGESVVSFLAKSSLPFPVLKEIWDLSVADPRLNYLRPQDFYVSMRLIAMAQASPAVPISASRLEMESARPLPLARLQNVPPPPAGAISQGLARAGGAPVLAHKPLVGTDPYAMSDQERSKYESFFPMYDSDRDGFVTGGEAVELFSKSRLPREQLRQIWQLADADGDSMLSLSEFCVGMHLIVCVSKKGLPCPATRPQSLLASTGSAASGGMNPAQALGGSHIKPVPQSPIVKPSPPMQPPSSPPSAMLPPGDVASSAEDAFSALAVDLPQKDPTSLSSEAEAGTPAPGQGPSATELALRATQPNTPSRSPTSTTNVSEDTSSVGDSTLATAGMHELVGASSALLAVARDVSTAQNQGTKAQSSSVQKVKVLVEQLQAEKASLGSLVEAGRMEQMDNERQLRELSSEIESLTSELETLRNKFQDQQKESATLRARVAQAAVERGTLLAEVKACGSSLRVQKEENDFLSRTVLGDASTSEEKLSSPQSPTANDEEGSPSPVEVAERLQISPEPEIDGPTEPAMPAKTPPPLPQPGMVSQPAVEDPFAAVVDGGSANAGISSPDGTRVGSQKLTNEEKEQDGFDAFPPNGFESGTDPFAINGLDEAASDPFATTDAVFTNATAAADGFDAFPSVNAQQQFDAFGQ